MTLYRNIPLHGVPRTLVSDYLINDLVCFHGHVFSLLRYVLKCSDTVIGNGKAWFFFDYQHPYKGNSITREQRISNLLLF